MALARYIATLLPLFARPWCKVIADDPNNSLSLYLHIPFCSQRCSYCDFNTYTSVDSLREAYSIALAKEAAFVTRDKRRRVHTIFFGGGTPSLMVEKDLSLILETIRESFIVTTDAEITLEANPDTLDLAYLSMLRDIGFNRLSLGVQSANPSELLLLARTHSFDTVISAVEMSRKVGFENINLDLIYGLPGQGLESWRRSLLEVLNLRPEHLSLYCLTIEEGTKLFRLRESGQAPEPDPDIAADQYEVASELCARAGFIHYEISNWALPGYQCEQNLTYWRNHEYLGLGAGAHGHVAGHRYEIVKQPRVYIRRMGGLMTGNYPWSPAVVQSHRLSIQEKMTDTVITQLRLIEEGLDLQAFSDRYGQSLSSAFPGTVEELMEMGLLHQKEQRLLLTKFGRLLSNQVFRRFV